MEPGKYRLFIVTAEGKEERWNSFPQYDGKGAEFQLAQMRKRLLDGRHKGQYRIAIFEERESRREICRFQNGQMV